MMSSQRRVQNHSNLIPGSVALVIVDVQNDFTEGGPTAIKGGDLVAYRIGAYLRENRQRYALVVTTQDWHIAPGDGHFSRHPAHCLAESVGAELDPELSTGAGRPITELVDAQLRKGQYGADYSGFTAKDAVGKSLPELLSEHNIGSLDVCGLAKNACVAATIRDSLRTGTSTRLLSDLSAGTSTEVEEAIEEELAALGAYIVNSTEAWS